MIQTLEIPRSHDRLTAFLQAFGLRASSGPGPRNLFVLGDAHGRPHELVFRCRGGSGGGEGGGGGEAAPVLASAGIDFGGAINPLVGALPDELRLALPAQPALQALAELLVAESDTSRCGGATVRERLCEVIVVLAIRRAIAGGTVNAGLLAGLADETLSPCLVAIHEAPARAWPVADLARIAGLSRAHFNARFASVVGTTPAAYVTAWRLAFGQSRLQLGGRVKAVAHEAGFGSQEAFSRAFSRAYGYPPSAVKRACAAR